MPQITRQFRGIEDLLESTERKDTINFVGTDISPVVRVDPPTLDLLVPTLEDKTVTGVATTVNMSTVPAGSYREIMKGTIKHDDPAAILLIDIRLVRDSDGAFIALRQTIANLTNPITLELFGQQHVYIPPGWHLRVIFPGLAVARVARVKTLHVDRPLGFGIIR